MIPNGFVKRNDAEVYINESRNEIVITGTPNEDDESHNCDVMGCSSVRHVIFRSMYNDSL